MKRMNEMHMTTTCDRLAAPHKDARRGMAMMLVLLALGIGVVLAGVALTARSSEPRIGAHAREMCSAQWAAESAARYAEAVLQTNTDWPSKVGGDGVLFRDMAFGTATATAVIKSDDGGPYQSSDREVLVQATGKHGSMEAVVERRVALVKPFPLYETVGLELGGMAAVVGGSIIVEDKARIGPFPRSPDARTTVPIRLGMFFSSSGALDIRSKALLSNVALAIDSRASGALANAAKSDKRFAPPVALPFTVPLLAEHLPSSMMFLPLAATNNRTFSGSPSTTLSSAGVYQNVDVMNTHTLTVDASVGDKYSFNDLTLSSAGVLRIKGRVFIEVRGSLSISGKSAIIYADEASSVVFFTRESLNVDDSVIGLDAALAANSSRTPDMIASYVAPARCRILALNAASGGDNNPNWRVRNGSIVAASLHNPGGSVELHDTSALIGRVTSRNLVMRKGATLWYDPAMDTRMGYCVLDGPLYANGALRPAVAAKMASFTSLMGVSIASSQLVDALKNDLTSTKWSGFAAGDSAASASLLSPFLTEVASGPLNVPAEGQSQSFGAPTQRNGAAVMSTRVASSAGMQEKQKKK